MNSTKTPSDGTLLGRTFRRFLRCWLLFFSRCCFLWCWLLLLFLCFRASFPCHRHSTLSSQAREGLDRFWALPWLLLIALLYRHIFTAGARVLSGHFLPTGVFYLALLPNIFATACFYQGLPGSRQFFLEVCRPSCWSSKHRPGSSVCLIHSNPRSYYYKLLVVKSLVICPLLVLNSFRLFKVCVKTVKTLWTRLDKKYCLKLLRWNCLISIHQG